jgi:16S rRNA (cytosine967-C5)-methyltransferase
MKKTNAPVIETQPDLYADNKGAPAMQADLAGDTPGDPLAARQAALEILGEVLDRKNSLDTVLENNRAFRALDTRDRAFCRMIVSTTLRRLGQIDDLIRKAEEKPSNKNLKLQNILRLGVAQILFMAVPDHAAVDTSVQIAEAAGMDRQKGFVNGLLRTITKSGKEWLSRQDEARLNTPEWLLKNWIEDYGLGEAATIAKANLAEARLDITVKDDKERNFWSSAFKATQMTTGSLRLMKPGPVHELPGYDEGMWWVQDAAAAIPARLFGYIKGKTVLELCAAPGGKTLQLAAQGAHVIALDRSAQRLKKLEENIARMKLQDQVEVIAADATVWRPQEAPEFILLDAPCTATGTIRRHPDVLHLKTPRDLEGLVNVQANILENAFNMLAPGGTLVYCTCSLQKVEGEAQILQLFEMHEDAYKKPIIPEELGGFAEAITEQGDLRILPYHQAALGGMDGFFISRITKAPL